MLTLHLCYLALPVGALLVFLLLELFALLLDAHLLDFEHLDLVVDVLLFHGAQLELIFDLRHLCIADNRRLLDLHLLGYPVIIIILV